MRIQIEEAIKEIVNKHMPFEVVRLNYLKEGWKPIFECPEWLLVLDHNGTKVNEMLGHSPLCIFYGGLFKEEVEFFIEAFVKDDRRVLFAVCPQCDEFVCLS